jgi:hypothetical protein
LGLQRLDLGMLGAADTGTDPDIHLGLHNPAAHRLHTQPFPSRSSAIAAAKHCRKAKTALRVVAAESPELRRVDTHSRTIALVILLSGTEPK